MDLTFPGSEQILQKPIGFLGKPTLKNLLKIYQKTTQNWMQF